MPVAGRLILAGPKLPERGHGEINAAPRDQVRMNTGEKGAIVFYMFDYVKQPDAGQNAGTKTGILQCGAHHPENTAPSRIAGSMDARFHQHNVKAGVLQCSCHVAVTPAYVEECAWRGEISAGGEDALIAVSEPERSVLDAEIDFIG